MHEHVAKPKGFAMLSTTLTLPKMLFGIKPSEQKRIITIMRMVLPQPQLVLGFLTGHGGRIPRRVEHDFHGHALTPATLSAALRAFCWNSGAMGQKGVVRVILTATSPSSFTLTSSPSPRLTMSRWSFGINDLFQGFPDLCLGDHVQPPFFPFWP